jgi:dihydroorotase-like cyclic amidohydrolase
LEAALAAKSRGVKIWVESVLPHLLLDKSYAERAGVEGMKHVMSPPLRSRENQQVLWSALAAGSIDTIGTDHCPFDTSQKLLGKDAFWWCSIRSIAARFPRRRNTPTAITADLKVWRWRAVRRS